ncbi:MAG: type II toxin-antitoxin system HicB family antitoxin [Acidimicrobiales bacterium]
MTDTYHATLEPDDEGWAAQVSEIPEVHARARTPISATDRLHVALAAWLEVPIEDVGRLIFTVRVSPG